ncbi:MAG: hypothetical protein FWF96_00530 [Kiritimatiellaeota bacterium]|nr:hypothetical protein [Kiritimatiellota bacterium]
MKNRILLAALLASLGGLRAAGQDEADVVLQQRETYFAQVRKVDAKYAAQTRELEQQLAEAVKALEARYVADANLGGVLAAREVLDAIEDPFVEVVTPGPGNHDALHRAVEQHLQKTRALDAEETRLRADLKARYIAHLEKIKQKLTTETKIEEALAIHNEIQRLGEEMRRAPKLPDPPPPPADEEGAAPPAETRPAPDKRVFLSEAQVIAQLKALSGSTVTFNGIVRSLESDGSSRVFFFLTLEGGLKVRLPIPANTQLAKRGNASVLRAQNADVLAAGARVAIQATVAKGIIHHAAATTFINPALVGSDSALTRRWFRADCGGPCPPLPQRYINAYPCGTCGNERVGTLFF